MTTDEKASKLAVVLADPNDKLLTYANIKDLLWQMAEWKDQNPSDELIKKICKLCDKFENDAPWQSASWCEHAEADDWERVYWGRLQFIKAHLKDKK